MAKGKKDKKGAGTDLVPADETAGKKGKGKAKGKKGAGKAGTAGPKTSKVPRPVHGRGYAWIGLLLQVPIALMLLQDQLTIEAAAKRSVLVLVGVMVVERVLAPLLMIVLDPKPDPAEAAPEPGTGPAEQDSPEPQTEPV
jgi:hypothetical protein